MRRRRTDATGLFFMALAVYLLTYVGAFKTNDERAMFSSTDSFIKRGEFTTNPIYWDYTNVGMLSTSGEMVPNYEPAQSILSIPLYLWGRALDAPVQGTMFFNLLVTAASVALLYLILVDLGYSRGVGIFAAALYAFATTAWPFSKTFFRDPLATFAYLLAIYALLHYRPPSPRGWKWPAVAGLALGLALTTKQVSVALLPSVALLLFAYERHRPDAGGERLKAAIAAAIPLAILLGLAQLYYTVTLSGVELFARDVVEFTTNPQLSTSDPLRMLRAGLGLTISPFRGIFWYAPVLLLGLAGALPFTRRHPWEGLAFLGLFGATLLGYSRYNYWSAGAGGAGWGSRYMLTVVPFLIILAAPLFEWAIRSFRRPERGMGTWSGLAGMAILILISIVSQIVGVSLNTTRYELTYILEQARIYGGVGEAIDATYMNPRFSPLIGNLRLLLGGSEPLDTAWTRLGPQGTWQLVPGGLFLALLYLAATLVGATILRRHPRLWAPVTGSLLALTVAVASLSLVIYRSGDARFDPYGVDRLLSPFLQELEPVSCTRDVPGGRALCDGVLVVPDPVLTDYFLSRLRAPLPWYAIGADPAPEDIQLLETLLQRYPTIYLIRDRSAQADAEQGRRAVEQYLVTHAYKQAEEQVENWARLLTFSAAGRVAEAWTGSSRLGEMALSGMEIRLQVEEPLHLRDAAGGPEPVEPPDDGIVRAQRGEILQVGLEWLTLSRPPANYTVFLQLLDESGQVVLQNDRPPAEGFYPTGDLSSGAMIPDHYALPLDLPPGRYRLITGLYRSDVEGLPRLSGPEGAFLSLAEIQVR